MPLHQIQQLGLDENVTALSNSLPVERLVDTAEFPQQRFCPCRIHRPVDFGGPEYVDGLGGLNQQPVITVPGPFGPVE